MTVVFAVASVFLIDADRGDIFFFAVFLLGVLPFLAAFLRVAALVRGAFFRFALALPLAFLLVAITASWTLICMIVAE
ncbi:MAG: hypothetical protein WBE94_20650 [Pseudolabrys sp.]